MSSFTPPSQNHTEMTIISKAELENIVNHKNVLVRETEEFKHKFQSLYDQTNINYCIMQAKDKEIEEFRKINAELRERLNALESRVQTLETGRKQTETMPMDDLSRHYLSTIPSS